MKQVDRFPKSISTEEFRALLAKGAKPKYGNVRMEYEGEKYDSKAELAFEMHLRLLRSLGKERGRSLWPTERG